MMNGYMGQEDPLVQAMMARRRQDQQMRQGQMSGMPSTNPGGGPVLVPQQVQQMQGGMVSQGSPPAGTGMGEGAANAAGRMLDAYRQKTLMGEQAQQATRQKLMIDALSGGITPGVGPGGMGSMAFGGPR